MEEVLTLVSQILDLPAADREQAIEQANLDAPRRAELRDLLLRRQLRWRIGETVGNYRLEAIIGRGGMSIVYRASTVVGSTDLPVAIKTVRPDLVLQRIARSASDAPSRCGNTREATPRTATEPHTATALLSEALDHVSTRFEQEADRLAALQHASIAAIHTAGFSHGLPYLVMELVRGHPIDVYCQTHRLRPDDRIGLILQTCEAVELAHHHLILHCDLKPGNLLVTDDGRVKLLDFGVARTLEVAHPDPASPTTLEPGFTPAFASPEQVSRRPLSVRSDVYSLGVVLYRLLTDAPPYTFDTESPEAWYRVICHEVPPAPSEAGAGSAAGNTDRVERARRRKLRGDLDAIILRALAKDDGARYPTVGALADDLRRHLDRRPLRAREGRNLHTAWRFARRHRTVASMLLLLVAIVLAGGISLRIEQQRTAAQRDLARARLATANQVTDFLVHLFDQSDPDQAKGENATAATLLRRGREALEADAPLPPASRSALLTALGRVHRLLADFAGADALLRQAVAIRRTIVPIDHRALAESLQHLALVQNDHQDFAQAIALFEEARGLLRDDPSTTPLENAYLLNDLAVSHHYAGDLPAAKRHYEHALAIREAHPDPHEAKLAVTLANLAALEWSRHAFARYETLSRRALVLLESQDPISLDVAYVTGNLASYYWLRCQHDEAEPLLRHARSILETLLAEDHPELALNDSNLGNLLTERGDLGAAREHVARSLAIRRAKLGTQNDEYATSLTALASIAEATGDLARARETLHEALTIRTALYPGGHYNTALTHDRLGAVEIERQSLAAAEAHYHQALTIKTELLPPGHASLAASQIGLAQTRWLQGKVREASSVLQEGSASLRRAVDQDTGDCRARAALAKGQFLAGEILLARGDRAGAQEAWAEALAVVEPRSGQIALVADRRLQARILQRLGRKEEADALRATLPPRDLRDGS